MCLGLKVTERECGQLTALRVPSVCDLGVAEHWWVGDETLASHISGSSPIGGEEGVSWSRGDL